MLIIGSMRVLLLINFIRTSFIKAVLGFTVDTVY